MEREDYQKAIENHFSNFWNNHCTYHVLQGTEDKFVETFRILKYPPKENKSYWIYTTCGMSQIDDIEALECFVLSPYEIDDELVELLTITAYFHQSKARLWYGHTVNFGKPWIANSLCDHGLFSLPYLDGEELEIFEINDHKVSCLWMLPITEAERDFKMTNGLDALETLLEENGLNYLDPLRKSMV